MHHHQHPSISIFITEFKNIFMFSCTLCKKKFWNHPYCMCYAGLVNCVAPSLFRKTNYSSHDILYSIWLETSSCTHPSLLRAGKLVMRAETGCRQRLAPHAQYQVYQHYRDKNSKINVGVVPKLFLLTVHEIWPKYTIFFFYIAMEACCWREKCGSLTEKVFTYSFSTSSDNLYNYSRFSVYRSNREMDLSVAVKCPLVSI